MKQIYFFLILLGLLFLTYKATSQIQGAKGSVSLPDKGQTSVTQKDIILQKQLWARLYNKIQFNNSWILHTELEVRRYIAPGRAYQSMLPRVHLHHKLGSDWEALVGIAYFTNTQPLNNVTEQIVLNVPEIRPMLGFEYTQKTTGRLNLGHRYWMEERFQHNYNETSMVLSNGYQFNFRARYRLQALYTIIKRENSKGTLKLNVSDEIFLNVTKAAIINTFDQNRIYVGLNYGFNKNFIFEAGYYQIYQASSKIVGKFYINDNIRITLYYNLKVKNKNK
jgi:hypothetical protein